MKKNCFKSVATLLLCMGVYGCSSSSDGAKYHGGSIEVAEAQNGIIKVESGKRVVLNLEIEPHNGFTKGDYTKTELNMKGSDAQNPEKRDVFATDNPATVIGKVNGTAELEIFALSKNKENYIYGKYIVEVLGQKFVEELILSPDIETIRLVRSTKPQGGEGADLSYRITEDMYKVLPEEATVKTIFMRELPGEDGRILGINNTNSSIIGLEQGKTDVLVEAVGKGPDSITEKVTKKIRVIVQ